ncbi:MAG: mechanosensitive ion channel family protein [Myxococcales bacterium]|nr:mechanosensitive ion channel family protein [Myxococcales bacterium]
MPLLANLSDRIYDITHIAPAMQEKMVVTIIALTLLWVMRYVTLRVIWKRTQDARARFNWGRTIQGVTIFVGILLIGRIWFQFFGSLTTYLGLLSAGIAIALKDALVNLAGRAWILWERPFAIGDRVQIEQYTGDVVDMRMFQFTLLEVGNWVAADQSTGRVVHIPNGWVFTKPQINFNDGFDYIWNEIPVLVTFDSDWEKAKLIISLVAKKHVGEHAERAEEQIKQGTKRYFIHYTRFTPTVYTSVRDSGVLLTLRYLVPTRQRRGSDQAIWEEVLHEFERRPDIEFAYPSQAIYHHPRGSVGPRTTPDESSTPIPTPPETGTPPAD